jgi:hypothetical protein
MINVFANQVVVIIIGMSEPIGRPSMRRLEFFNESCIMLSSYSYFVFTPFVKDPWAQHYVGYWLIGVALLNLGTNLLLISIETTRALYRAGKKFYYKKVKKRE